MSPNNVADFLDQLILKTSERKVIWERTSKVNSYKASLKTGNIIIEQVDARMLLNPSGENYFYNFSIFNEKADKIFEQSTGGMSAVVQRGLNPNFDRISRKIGDLFNTVKSFSGNSLKNMFDELNSL